MSGQQARSAPFVDGGGGYLEARRELLGENPPPFSQSLEERFELVGRPCGEHFPCGEGFVLPIAVPQRIESVGGLVVGACLEQMIELGNHFWA